MTSNNTDVTHFRPSSDREHATERLQHVQLVADEIDVLTAPDEPRSRPGMVADRHREIGECYREAEIYATLEVAAAIDRLAEILEHVAPGPISVYLPHTSSPLATTAATPGQGVRA